jgi:TonB-dependent Receptor Plug Domain
VGTARKRSESLQQVPIAVQAFGTAEIERAGIKRPEDYIGLTPGVSIINSVNVGEGHVNMRGIHGPFDTEQPFALVLAAAVGPLSITAGAGICARPNDCSWIQVTGTAYRADPVGHTHSAVPGAAVLFMGWVVRRGMPDRSAGQSVGGLFSACFAARRARAAVR